MEINITVIFQIIIFLLYIYLCKKYVWPYINNIIERRQKEIYIEYKKIDSIKNNILFLKNKAKKIISDSKKKSIEILLEAKYESNLLIKKSKKKAKYEYKNIINQAKFKINIEKKKIYSNFFKKISNILNLMLIKITNNTFDSKLNNKFIYKILKNYKF